MTDQTPVQKIIEWALSGGGVFAALGVALRYEYAKGKGDAKMEQMKKSLDAAHGALRAHGDQLQDGAVNFATISAKLDNLAEGQKRIEEAMIRHEERGEK